MGILFDLGAESSFWEVISGLFAAGAGLCFFFEFLTSAGREKGKFLVLLAVFLAGSQACAQDLFDVERAKVAGAEAVAMTEPDQVSPTPPQPNPPQPTPDVGEICSNCNGTGKVRSGDGLSWMNCQVCGGDGKLSIADAMSVIVKATKERTKLLVQLEEARREMRELEGLISSRGSPGQNSTSHSAAQVQQPAIRPLKWISLSLAGEEALKQNKPMFVFWTAEGCRPCEEFVATVLPKEEVLRILQDCICVKVDFGQSNVEERTAWKVRAVPAFFVLPSSGGVHQRYVSTNGWGGFADWLGNAVDWAKSEEPISYLKSQKKVCNCDITGICICGDECECPDCPEHTPSNNRLSGVVRNAALTKQDRIVGVYSVQYGSAGGYPQYYTQPMYYQRPVYSTPSYGGYYYNGPFRSYGSYYGGGYSRPMICGPGGCF
jgi:hypothetical protein